MDDEAVPAYCDGMRILQKALVESSLQNEYEKSTPCHLKLLCKATGNPLLKGCMAPLCCAGGKCIMNSVQVMECYSPRHPHVDH
jgi:hypothetical protein